MPWKTILRRLLINGSDPKAGVILSNSLRSQPWFKVNKNEEGMSTKEVSDYFDKSENSEVRPDLFQGVDLVGAKKIAIDCGCGAGSDIAFLLSKGFLVHAFDIEAESISRCRERFKGETNLSLSQASFTNFNYTEASLIHADASLFYCSPNDFDQVWYKITNALIAGGIFVGSFLGIRDTTAGPGYQKEAFWPDVMPVYEDELRLKFEDFDILSWVEHELDGKTAQDINHHWHVFSVVAKKK
jgi:SAM-dependent methyltransferase